MLKTIVNFLNYWYFRYLLVTELYMVEKWERVMIHIVLFIMLSIVSTFNTYVVLGLISTITHSYLNEDTIKPDAIIHNEF